jgi:hypothetical protein
VGGREIKLKCIPPSPFSPGQAYGNLKNTSKKAKAALARIIGRGGDDELTDLGRAQAVALARDTTFVQTAAEFDVVLVSPLLRALETFFIAFNTKEMQQARTAAGRPALTVFIHPELREVNSFSKRGGELYWRHCGHRLSYLKEFASTRAPAWFKIEWHPAMHNDSVWWDAEGVGDVPNRCTVNYSANYDPRNGPTELDTAHPSAFLRSHSFSNTLRCLARERSWTKVCCVAHENMYRCLTGVLNVDHPPKTLNCVLHMNEKCILQVKSQHVPPALGGYLRKMMPVTLAHRTSQKRDVVVVLGCSVQKERRRRVAHSASLMRELGGCPVLYMGDWNTCTETRTALTHLFTEEEQQWVLLDQCSRVTDCHVDHALALITAMHPDVLKWTTSHAHLRVHIVTNSWHIPRALVLFKKQMSFALEGMKALHGIVFVVAACYYSRSDNGMTVDHLRYGVATANNIINSPLDSSIWNGVATGHPLWRDCGRELRTLSDNIQIYAAARIKDLELRGLRYDSCDNSMSLEAVMTALQSGQKGLLHLMTSAYPDSVKATSCKVFPLAHIPFGPHGNYALHYAASFGKLQLCKDLVFFYGASITQLNDELLLPRDLAKHDPVTLSFLDEAAHLMHPWWAPGMLSSI